MYIKNIRYRKYIILYYYKYLKKYSAIIDFIMFNICVIYYVLIHVIF